MSFVEFFIRRPIFAGVCSILVVLAGAISIPTLPIAQYPEIALPQVTVTSDYPGASAEVVESAVTTPLEESINGVEGMEYMTSTSSNDGVSTITITFAPDHDIDIAAVDVQNRVATAQARLPDEVKQAGITVTKNSAGFVLAVALFAKNGAYDQEFISNYADVYVSDALKRIRGVADVHVFGERKFAMRVWLDPEKLAQRGLTASDVVQALSDQNVEVAAGSIGQAPAPATQSYAMNVQVAGRLADARAFGDIVLAAKPDGALVRVADVARVELGAEDYSTSLRFDGKRAIGLGVLQLPQANALEVRTKVLDTMAELAKRFPPGLEWVNAHDTTRAVSASVHEVVVTLVIAIALVVLVIFVFLQSFRSTLVPAVAIPVSLVGTFAFVRLFGFTINTLTLFGLTLATGLVVDDAIVVIENIQRHVDEQKLGVRAAAAASMKEVTGAVVATSLVLMAAFAPVAFLPGTTGRIYQQFSLTIAFSVGISLFNSLTLTPALSALLLRRTREKKNVFFRLFDRVFERTRSAYLRVLCWLLGWRAVTLGAYAAVLAGAVLLLVRVPRGFLPEEDQGWFIVQTQAPSGASLAYTERVLAETEPIIRGLPGVRDIFQIAGFSFAGTGSDRGLTFVSLAPWGRRPPADEIIARARRALLADPHALDIPFAPPAIRGVGSFGGFQFEIEDRRGATIDELAAATHATVDAAARDPRLVGAFTGFTADDPQLFVDVDRSRVKQLGMSLGDVFDTLQVFTGSLYVNDFTFSNRAYRVYVQADAKHRSTPESLRSFYARAPAPAAGGKPAMVPLGELIHVHRRATAGEISHFNLFRSTEVNGGAAPGRSTGDAIRAMEQIASRTLPQGFGYEWSGIAREQVQAGSQSLLIFALAVALVFLVLAAQYESFVLPVVVLMAVPLGVLGAMLGQWLRSQANDVFCQIGLVMLVGLSAKNAILIVEFARQLRARGRAIADAAVEAASERLRPILMTSFAFMLGVFPLMVAAGSGAVARHSMGTTVFGGMLVSTVANLFLVPALWAMIEKLRERALGRLGEAAEPGAG